METRKINYEGVNFEVREDGQIKVLERQSKTGIILEERVLPHHLNNRGYKQVHLSIQGNNKRFLVHRLVAIAFIPNPDRLPFVDHIDSHPSNNCRENLRWVSNQTNMQSGVKKRNGSSSKYRGVFFNKGTNKWASSITVDGEKINIGNFKKETDAAYFYNLKAKAHGFNKEAMNALPKDYTPTLEPKRKTSSDYTGVSWNKSNGKWEANIKVSKKKKYLGLFETEEQAALAYNKEAINQGRAKRFLNDIRKPDGDEFDFLLDLVS